MTELPINEDLRCDTESLRDLSTPCVALRYSGSADLLWTFVRVFPRERFWYDLIHPILQLRGQGSAPELTPYPYLRPNEQGFTCCEAVDPDLPVLTDLKMII